MRDDEIDLSELDCEIFVDGAPRIPELIGWLGDAIGGNTTEDGVQAGGVEMIVEDNDDADSQAKTEPKKGFLFFDYFVEVYFAPSVEHERRVKTVSALLEALWGRGLPAVAACDYEDELPRRGGVDESAPWPVNG